ncbi:hypothetical protein [uncultured Chitinophaga sp.]|uniref:hypothetical protein n=1 Tax=uncultured Chitinophaga sp. TaxID=339340 RepID=UPI0025EE3000|nr:hypothetical protein [uncultured Chitinophaga sp.]
MTLLSRQFMPVITLGLAAGFALSACSDKDKPTTTTNADIVLKNHSATPAFVTKKNGFETLEIFSLIGSDDVLTESPSFIFGGSADGTALLKQDDKYLMLVNHEDNFAVSRITLDKTFKPVKGEYILNSDGGQWRLCSATLATPAEHGFGPIYLTSGESSVESYTNGIDPFAATTAAAGKHELPALGHWSAENAVPLPKKAYKDKTIIIIGDDDSGAAAGQLAMYIGNSVGNLNSGSLYMLKRKDNDQVETNVKVGQTYEVEFVKVDNYETKTGAAINAEVDVLKALKFGRVEDIDYRKGSSATGREVYFNVTGQDKSGFNADGSRTKFGRTYRLVMDATNPLKGTLEVILDGDDKTGIAKDFQNVDNICVTENYVYIQEDSNTYGEETHDGYIYQYDIKSKQLKIVLEIDHHRNAADAATYGSNPTTKKGSWEFGALVDVSDVTGVPNMFTLAVQPHSWTGTKYAGVDGGTKRVTENQASQILVIKGLPK